MRSLCVCLLGLSLLAVSASADTVVLGSAASFAVLAGATVTNTGVTTLNGNVGVSPGSAITGGVVCPGGADCFTFTGGTTASLATSTTAQTDLTAAMTGLNGLTSFSLSPTSYTAGVVTFSPGVYKTGTTFDLTGALTLDAHGLSNVAFVYLVGSSLTAEVGSTVNLINAGSNVGVYWVEGQSASLLQGSTFVGNILAGQSISLGQGVTITCGSALASVGQVSLINDTISTGCNGFPFISGTTVTGGTGTGGGTLPPPGPGGPPAVPEPSTLLLLGSGIAGLVGKARMTRAKAPRA